MGPAELDRPPTGPVSPTPRHLRPATSTGSSPSSCLATTPPPRTRAGGTSSTSAGSRPAVPLRPSNRAPLATLRRTSWLPATLRPSDRALWATVARTQGPGNGTSTQLPHRESRLAVSVRQHPAERAPPGPAAPAVRRAAAPSDACCFQHPPDERGDHVQPDNGRQGAPHPGHAKPGGASRPACDRDALASAGRPRTCCSRRRTNRNL